MLLTRSGPWFSIFARLLLLVGSVATVFTARAEPLDDEAPEATHEGDPLQRERAALEPENAPSAVPRLWLDLDGGLRLTEGRSQVSAGLALGGSFDELVKTREIRRAAPRAKSHERKTLPNEDFEEPRDSQVAPAPRALLILDGALARGAVKAALARMNAETRTGRLDDLGTRARVSGLVPEVRVRVARVVDEDQTLSPTEYDPGRLTASGGVSFYLEGRATFRLDRLVFADEEIAIERLRIEGERLERERIDDVLGALAQWQRADAVLGASDSDEAAIARAEVESAVAAATLDVWTDGWFTRALSAKGHRSRE